MLDLEALVVEMQGLARDVAEYGRQTLQQREAALDQLHTAREMEGLRKALLDFPEDIALPAEGRDMLRAHEAPPAEDYTVIATDGSQIAPDPHHIAPWYVVNAGCAVLRYGKPDDRAPCRLSSHPVLLPPNITAPDAAAEETRTADASASAVAIRGRLEIERLVSELDLAREALEGEGDAGRTVLLLDGPLVQWRMLNDLPGSGDQQRVIDLFRRLLSTARETRTPIAGYISRSQAVSWVSLLRFSLCPNVPSTGKLCPLCEASFLKPGQRPAPGAHHTALAAVRDIQIAERLLPAPGMRTEVIELKSKVWEQIRDADDAAGFFYLNTGIGTSTGGEISRVEIPQWVWQDDALMERLHAALWDQCDSGRGYPMVLSEAHEAAVVRSPDREAFYTLIDRVLADEGVDSAMPSAKAMSKRRPLA